MSKKCQKSCFLMAKSSFSSKFTSIDQNVIKNEWKMIIYLGAKMWSNLTTKRGDSGSAGTPGEKCVIIWAPKFDTKVSKN